MQEYTHTGGRVLSDLMETPLVIPANKLDADQYSAEDIDGVTESIFGSGNMAYASLQASQTDAQIALDEAVNPELEHIPDQENAVVSGGGNATDIAGDAFKVLPVENPEIPTDTDRALDSGDAAGANNIGSEGNFSNATVGALGASTLSSDAGSFSSSGGAGMGGDSNFDNSTGGNTTAGNTVNNVTNIVNAGDTVDNILNTVNETINNITNLGDELVDNVINLGDDIINTILDGDITEVTQILTTEITEVTEILTTQIDNITETVNNILQDFGVTEITNHITDVTNDVIETVTTIINGMPDDVLGGGDISVAGLDLDLPGISLDPEGIVGDIDIEIEVPEELLDPGALADGVEDLVESLDDLALADPADILGILGDQGVVGGLDLSGGGADVGEDQEIDLNGIMEDLQNPLNIEDDIGLLGGDGGLPGGLGGILGDGGDTSWTESTIDAGGLFDDMINGIGGEGDALPDPAGTVAEGLGALDVEPNLGGLGGGLGGLFG